MISLIQLYFIVNLGTIVAHSVINLSSEESNTDFPFITWSWMLIPTAANLLFKYSDPKVSREVKHFRTCSQVE